MPTPPESGRMTTLVTGLLRREDPAQCVSSGCWGDLEREFGSGVYVEALHQLTRLEFEPAEARDAWLGVLAHREDMTRRMGRPVSVIAAVCDFFLSVRPTVKDPILVEVYMLRQKEEVAFRDELTGLYNRRYLAQEAPREVERFRRFGHPFSLLMVDLDHFKRINDTYGHQAGDQVLREVGQVLGNTARLYDQAVRYGGEEFVILLPQAGRDEALCAGERIRAAVWGHSFVYEGQPLGLLTVSVGSATFPLDAVDMAGLIRRADQALYEAKRERNQVRAYQDVKRRNPRFPLDAPVNLRAMGRDRRFQGGRVKDISFSGALCQLEEAPGLNDLLEVSITDPEKGTRFFTLARVRRVSEAGNGHFQLGLSFELSSPEDQRTLMTLIEAQNPAIAPPPQ